MRLSPLIFTLLLTVPLALVGCAMPPAIPSDQLNNFALVVPQDLYGNGSMVTEVDSGPQRSRVLQTSEGPGILAGVSTRRGANVTPGRHSVQVTTCHSGDTRSCGPDVYIFEAKAGLAYILRGPGQNIDVLDRFQKTHVGYLHSIGNQEYVSDQAFLNLRVAAQKQIANENSATMERRRNEQIFIRRIGARVCQDSGRGMVYIGYVERVTDDKVQIRISDAHLKGDANIHPKGFSPTIIWDFPMQWDLCE